MNRMIAYCGLVCTDCEAYTATQANDLAALERLAAKAREEYGMGPWFISSVARATTQK